MSKLSLNQLTQAHVDRPMRYTHWPIWYYNLDMKQLFGGKRWYAIQVYHH